MDLYILNEIQKLKSGGVGSSSSVNYIGYKENPATQHLQSWASFVGVAARYHSDSYAWNNSHPNGAIWYTNSNDAMHSNTTCCMPLGCVSASTAYDSGDQVLWRGIKHSKRNMVGLATDFWTHRNSSSYMPILANVMFIKNPTNADIAVTNLNWQHSTCSGTYDGAGVSLWTPNSTGYSGVTGGTWTSLANSSGNTYETQSVLSFTVPAKTTVMLVAKASFYYWTSAWNGSHAHGVNQFYNLNNLDTAGLECDLDLSQAYYQYNSDAPSILNANSADENLPKVFWEDAAKFFKDY